MSPTGAAAAPPETDRTPPLQATGLGDGPSSPGALVPARASAQAGGSKRRPRGGGVVVSPPEETVNTTTGRAIGGHLEEVSVALCRAEIELDAASRTVDSLRLVKGRLVDAARVERVRAERLLAEIAHAEEAFAGGAGDPATEVGARIDWLLCQSKRLELGQAVSVESLAARWGWRIGKRPDVERVRALLRHSPLAAGVAGLEDP